MELFKKRLKQLGKDLLFWLVTLIVAGLIAWGVISIPTAVAKVICMVFFGIFALGLVLSLGYNLWKFIKWLFIEPFKK